MIFREAIIQAMIECGLSRQEAELKSKFSDACLPDASPLTYSPVIPGHERDLIDFLKEVYRQVEANPAATQQWLRSKMRKRVEAN